MTSRVDVDGIGEKRTKVVLSPVRRRLRSLNTCHMLMMNFGMNLMGHTLSASCAAGLMETLPSSAGASAIVGISRDFSTLT